ncbi:MAG: hypothetical protein IJF21_05145 [Clostridia bacterium]|nr:hypothetical protein [Clostridia bacterium]
MTTEEKIKKPYIKRLALWAILTASLFVTCYFYYKYSETEFSPVGSVALIALISFIAFNSMGLLSYLTDKSFSGTVVHVKIDIRLFKESTLDRKIEKRAFIGMTIDCDDGKSIFFEQMLPNHLTNKNPYCVGDRVYHIKGAKHTCRFPRGDTEKKYDPVSVICPVCGAILPLGSKVCAFCENDLPWDPR